MDVQEKTFARPYMSFCSGPITGRSGIEGLEFDFNHGARLKVPEGEWRVRLIDSDACVTLYEDKVSDAVVSSTKKYFINFRLEVYREEQLVFEHDYDATGKKVLFKFPVGALGDVLAWFPYVSEFQKKHGCIVYCALASEMAAIFSRTYPEFVFVGPDEWPEEMYATYYLGIFYPCSNKDLQPLDWRMVGLQKTVAGILRLEEKEVSLRLASAQRERKIAEPYVCIAAQASSQAKYWNNPRGWLETVRHLKERGYRVLCIDQKDCHGSGSYWNLIPHGAEDFTGDLPLQERIDLLSHAEFFVGLASGLSWLAWGVGTPVVMISGFSLPLTEFATPYRVINYHSCTGCCNDSALEFDVHDFAWCPRHKDTERQFECTRLITPQQVNRAIDRLIDERCEEKTKKEGHDLASE